MREDSFHEIEASSSLGFLSKVDAYKLDGWRLVQILCVQLDDGGHELTYSFGGDLALWSLRVRLAQGETIASITPLYPAAFLYENEIRDLYGVRIERIAADWRGKTYGESPHRPLKKVSVTPVSSEGAAR